MKDRNITRTHKCDHLFIHLPTATLKWKCVKCGQAAEADTPEKSSIQKHLHKTTMQHKTILISFPNTTDDKTLQFAEHLDCVSQSENPLPSYAVRKVFRTILGYYSDEKFQKCLEEEGIDALAYVQRCINRGMKESLGKK